MMSLPFFGVFLALLSAVSGFRTGAVVLTLLSVVATLVLFRLHATDSLAINL